MKRFEVTVLGCRAALPSSSEITSSFVLHCDDRCFIIDCGEATQMKIQQYGIKLNKLSAILISHLHGDHVFGLPGLLTSLSSHRRTESLTIIGPVGIEQYVTQNMLLSHSFLSFEIEYIQLSESTKHCVWQDSRIVIEAFPLVHRVPTYGYIITEKLGFSNINTDKIKEYNLTIPEIKAAKYGEDIPRLIGETIPNAAVVLASPPIRSFAYVSDTQYDSSIAQFIKGVSTIYHEATYLEAMKGKANEYMHSTALEAAQVARDAGAKALYLGHVSARYEVPSWISDEAKNIFTNVEVAFGGMRFEID